MKAPQNKAGFRAGRDAQAVQENIETLTGQRGNGLDRAITVRDMQSLGIAAVQKQAASNKPVTLVSKIPPDTVVQSPHAPEQLIGHGGFGSIALKWANPTFKGFAFAEVWRSSEDDLGTAVLVATTMATVFGDVVSPGSTFYYWVRFVNSKNVRGPYNATEGLLLKTNNDVSNVINDIGTAMGESELVKSLTTSISELTTTVSTVNEDLSTEIENANSDIEKAKQQLASATEDINTNIEKIEKAYKKADKSANSSISELQQTVTKSDEALAKEIDSLSTDYQNADSEISSTITYLKASVATANEVLTKEVSQLEANVKQTNADLGGSISALRSSLVDSLNVVTKQLLHLNAAYEAKNTKSTINTKASITELKETVTDEFSATAKTLEKIESEYKTADSQTNSTITELEETVSNNQSATATKLEKIESEYKTADSQTNSAITELEETVSSENQTLAKAINQVSNKVDGEITSAVETNSKAITEIDESGGTTYQAMWGAKAQVSDVTAGIGLMVTSDSEGNKTSQVAISASQVFFFDPNTETPELSPLLAIEDGKVVIPNAMIEKGVVQILHAEQITADKVVAGISIDSPQLTSAKIFGGEAGFGSGGPYNGYNTFIYADGLIKTNNINAYGGYFSNVTIAEDCEVLGKLKAGQIVGDVYKTLIWNKTKSFLSPIINRGQSRTWHLMTFYIDGISDIDRILRIPIMKAYASYLRIYEDGVLIANFDPDSKYYTTEKLHKIKRTNSRIKYDVKIYLSIHSGGPVTSGRCIYYAQIVEFSWFKATSVVT